MQKIEVDVAVLGAGTAGLVARRNAAKAGASTMMIDPGPLGTTCARVGCMPSKLLVAAADAAHLAQHAEAFGVHAQVEINDREVMERVRAKRDFFVSFVLQSVDDIKESGAFLSGRARFLDAHTLAVEDAEGKTIAEVKAKSFVIATGSSSFVPPPYRGLSKKVLQFNDDVFEWETLPESVLVVGTGVIALELGQSLHRLGVRTTLVGIQGLLGPLSDPKMLKEAHSIFTDELDLHSDFQLDSIQEVEDGVEIKFTDPDGSKHEGKYQYVLMAAGRSPNLSSLDLEKTGIPLHERGIPPWDKNTGQVGDSHVFLAGDVNGFRPLLHEAADEGRIVGVNAAHFPDVMVSPRQTMLAIVFTDPQIALVGESWKEMDCTKNRVGTVSYWKQGRARVMGQNKGMVRIYGEAHTGLLLGAEMIGPRVEHTAHLLAWAIQKKMTVQEALTMPFYHPVIEEGIRTALRDLEHQLQLSRKPGAACEEFGPGD